MAVGANGPSPSSLADLTSTFESLTAPVDRLLRERLARMTGLGASERRIITDSAVRALAATLRLRLGRLLLLEMHGARLAGELKGPTSGERWREYIALARDRRFWSKLSREYPHLDHRLRVVSEDHVAAVVEFAERFEADRGGLAALGGTGELTGLRLGAGDNHRNGRSVFRVDTGAGTTWYKPRPPAAALVFADLLRDLQKPALPGITLRSPEVLPRPHYGWHEHIQHAYCEDETSQGGFYRNLGALLAALALVRASDMHLENIIAAGPVPVVIDCETLLTPAEPSEPRSTMGGANDRAGDALTRVDAAVLSVLRIGVLPARSGDGTDLSATGAIPGQQPAVAYPALANGDTDAARVAMEAGEVISRASTCHPSPDPHPERYWDHLLSGYRACSDRISDLGPGRVRAALGGFRSCEMRMVARATTDYVECIRALWHPAALRDQESVVATVFDMLKSVSEGTPFPVDDDGPIHAEISQMLRGDVPLWSFVPAERSVASGTGTSFALPGDPIDDAYRDWSTRDPDVDEQIIRLSLATAFRGHARVCDRLPDSAPPPAERHEELLRSRVAGIVEQLCRTAILGDDGTATWIGTRADRGGLGVSALGPALYDGLPGPVLALAAYAEARRGAAMPHVDALDETLTAGVETLRRAHRHEWWPSVGGYSGLGSGIWTWLVLDRLGVPDALEDALRLARGAARHIEADRALDVIAGSAGIIVPLLDLHARTSVGSLVDAATAAADKLAGTAVTDGRRATWPTLGSDRGLGGFAHGVTGIGWALARLALVTGDDAQRALADLAFAREEELFDASARAWRDAREDAPTFPAGWCHGSVGIGLAMADLHLRTGDPGFADWALTAVRFSVRAAFGWEHSLCHGDLGAWELLRLAPGAEREADLRARCVVAGLGEHGLRFGPGGAGTNPCFMDGSSGVAYQLLRMVDPSLPSALLLGG